MPCTLDSLPEPVRLGSPVVLRFQVGVKKSALCCSASVACEVLDPPRFVGLVHCVRVTGGFQDDNGLFQPFLTDVYNVLLPRRYITTVEPAPACHINTRIVGDRTISPDDAPPPDALADDQILALLKSFY